MQFDEFQARVTTAADSAGGLTTLLDLGAHAGALLHAHSRYLTDGLDYRGSTTLIARELGALLGQVAAIATAAGLSLDEIARGNVAKIRMRAQERHLPTPPAVPDGPIHASKYQQLAAMTDEDAQDGVDPLALGVPMLGLAGEAGTLLVAQKKAYRDRARQVTDPAFLATELGDVLWYSATVARHSQLDLDVILASAADLAEARQHERTALVDLPRDLPVLDETYPDQERFPRQLLIRFQERRDGDRVEVSVTLTAAEPNKFPDGPVDVGVKGKKKGFVIPQTLGDSLTDNSRRVDDYRFHDAIHLGFLAVMGWSPLVRSLLQLKRRSDAATDESEDGARAIFAEEGLAAVLAKRATRMQGFLTERSVDDETLEMLTTVLEDLEVHRMPTWLWRRAVSQGFSAMRALADGPGGFLVVDLDARSLTYHKTPPLRGIILTASPDSV